MCNRLLERLTSGEQPMEIKTILASTLSADVRELSDLDMIKCLEWEYFVPEGREELLDEVF